MRDGNSNAIRHYGCHTQQHVKVWEIMWKWCYKITKQINFFWLQQRSISAETRDQEGPHCLQTIHNMDNSRSYKPPLNIIFSQEEVQHTQGLSAIIQNHVPRVSPSLVFMFLGTSRYSSHTIKVKCRHTSESNHKSLMLWRRCVAPKEKREAKYRFGELQITTSSFLIIFLVKQFNQVTSNRSSILSQGDFIILTTKCAMI